MQRAKQLRGLFLDRQRRLSIRRLREAPARLGLAHTFVRVGIDLSHRLVVYEQLPEPPIFQIDTDKVGESQSPRYQERVRELVQRGIQAARTAPHD